MKRREFITLLGSAAVGWPLAASAQTQPKIPRVGCAFYGTPTISKHVTEAFRQALRELGYVEGQTIVLEFRWAEGRIERMPELLAELVGLKVDVLVATAAVAAKNATQTIPIVTIANDPVGLGLVGSLSRPGGNVTGLSYLSEDIIAKRLELLKDLVPGLLRVGVLKNPMFQAHANLWKQTEVAAQRLGVALEALELRGPEDFEAAFATAKQRNAQALFALDDPLTYMYQSRITALAASSRLPAMYAVREYPDAGGLMSYGASVVHLHRRAAKPADLPIEQSTKFDWSLTSGSPRRSG